MLIIIHLGETLSNLLEGIRTKPIITQHSDISTPLCRDMVQYYNNIIYKILLICQGEPFNDQLSVNNEQHQLENENGRLKIKK